MEWQKLQAVHELARRTGVSYSMHYAESDDSWYFSVHSSAPSEEWIGRNHSFDIAVKCVTEWMESLIKDA